MTIQVSTDEAMTTLSRLLDSVRQGEEVIIRLEPPEDPFRRGPEIHPAEAYGEIMHCRPKKKGEYKVGVRFPRQSEAMEAVIRAWFNYFGEDPEKEKKEKKEKKK